MSLDIAQKLLDDQQVELTVTVPDDRAQQAMRQAARKLARKIRIPGFRPGKAPYNVVLQRVGQGAILDEALDTLGQDVYREALEQAEVNPYSAGSMTNVELDPLRITYVVPLRPEVDLGDYRDIRVDYVPAELDDDELEEVLEQMRAQQAVIEDKDGPAELGNVVNLNVSGTLVPLEDDGSDDDADDDEEIVDEFLMDESEIDVILHEKLNWPAPGFAPHLIGIADGETREVAYTFPDDFENEDLAGRQATFTVTCNKVKTRTLPDWSDELAARLGTDGEYESLLDLRMKVRHEMTEYKQQEREEEYRLAATARLVEGATVKFPPQMLDEELETARKNLDQRLKEQNLSLEDYMKFTQRTEDDINEELRPGAIERLKRMLSLSKLVELEGIHVHDEDVDAEVERLIGNMGGVGGDDENDEQRAELQAGIRNFYNQPQIRQTIFLDVLGQRANDTLVRIAKGEYDPAMHKHDHAHDHADEEPAEAPAAQPATAATTGQVAAAVEEAVGLSPEAKARPQRKAPPAASDKPEPLKKLEGIGPKTQTALHEAGITTFAQVAEMTPDAIRVILDDAGLPKVINPATWPEQAALAAAGDWDALTALQTELSGGKR